MTNPPTRFRALALVLVTGLGCGPLFHGPLAGFLTSAAAQSVAGLPTATPTASSGQQLQADPAATAPALVANGQPAATRTARADAKDRHLAPPGTFYLLSYVAVKTDKGVDGFDPGQEVHLVEVHRPTRTLVVSDGHAQVEVPPSKLTNDMDLAALVRRNDEASQAQIAVYIQAEEAASVQAERQAALSTAEDLERRRQQQAAEANAAIQNQTAQNAAQQANALADQPAAPQANTYAGDNGYDAGYYNEGGYGYGSPYGYFTGGQTVVIAPQVPPAAPAPANTAPAVNRIAAPEGRAPIGRPR